MFLLDDLLLAPINGLTAVCRKVYEAAQDELDGREKAILADLAELHKMMDVGQIGDDDFNVREESLLDRLEACRRAAGKDRQPQRNERTQDAADGT